MNYLKNIQFHNNNCIAANYEKIKAYLNDLQPYLNIRPKKKTKKNKKKKKDEDDLSERIKSLNIESSDDYESDEDFVPKRKGKKKTKR